MTEDSGALGSAKQAPTPTILAPPVAGAQETLDSEEAVLPLGQLGTYTQEPSESSSSGGQFFVIIPQVSITEPEQDNGKSLWRIIYMCAQVM